MQFQARATDDNRPGRVIDSLAQEVLPEASLFALDHLGQRPQRPARDSLDRGVAVLVVEQGIYETLQPALFLAQDHFGSLTSGPFANALVGLEDLLIEVIEVTGNAHPRGRQPANRTQVGRQDWQALQDHPLRPIATAAKGLNDLQPGNQLLLARPTLA